MAPACGLGGSGAARDPLGMSAETMRELGYWVVDRVVEHAEQGPGGPVIRTGTSGELRRLLGGPVPEAPGDPRAGLQTLLDVALSNMQHGDHPRYFARVPGPSSFAGVLGEWLGTGYNALAASWGGGSGPAAVEVVVLEWLRELLGLPAGTEGIIVSGGSLANLTALATARTARGSGVAYLSGQTHASIVRDLRTLGFADREIRILSPDRHLRLTAERVAAAIDEDRAGGFEPRIVVGTAGTTNTGAVDELAQLGALCEREGLWLHVDGAYGGPAALCDAGRLALAGMELADSLVIDPHKWLFTPYDAGIAFIRHPGLLETAFSIRPEYLADVQSTSGEVDFGNRGLELSRRARALKLWLILRTYGVSAIREAIAHGIALAEHAQSLIEADPVWELVTPAQLGIITFARAGWTAEEHAASAARLAVDGFAAVTSTVLDGRQVLRLCTINPLTTHNDLAETLDRLGAAPDASHA